MTVHRRRLALLVAGLAPLAVAATAQADTRVLRDHEGRAVRFDVRARGVELDWYADLLRNAAHGPEIARVTVRIVPWSAMRAACGATAAGCYRGSRRGATIIVPAGEDRETAHTLLHEYGHHVDASHGVAGASEPNGTASWWRARGMAARLARGEVRRDYSRGWSRSVGEIFAEDYAQLHVRFPYKIRWIGRPGATVLAALRRDLTGAPASPAPGPPLLIVRRGTLEPGAAQTIRFGLLGPGRRVTFSAELTGAQPGEARGRLEVRCGSRTVFRSLGTSDEATLERSGLGPASCTATLRSSAAEPQRYTVRLRLGIQP